MEDAELLGRIRQILADNADAVAMYRGGKATALGFLVGQVMKEMKGKADPKVVTDLMKAAIG